MQNNWIVRGREVLDIEIEALRYVQGRIDASFDRAVAMLTNCTGRVAVTGIGKSGLVGRKIAATLSSTGTPAFFLHPVEGAHGDLGSVRAGDVVIAISYSGKSVELNAILPALRSLGVHVIAMTGGVNSPMVALADVVLDCTIPREACPMNLVPTSSTTATLALGDALAVCLIDSKAFTASDFKKFHPGGALGQRLRLSVADIMHAEAFPVAPAGISLGDALHLMDKGALGALVLTDNAGLLAGIITDGDIRRILCRGSLALTDDVARFMTKAPSHATADQSAAELMDVMEQKGITVLPVVEKPSGRVVGIVHMHDLLGKGEVRFAHD